MFKKGDLIRIIGKPRPHFIYYVVDVEARSFVGLSAYIKEEVIYFTEDSFKLVSSILREDNV